MIGVFDKIAKKIKIRLRHNCDKCKDKGYILSNLPPLDSGSPNTFGNDIKHTIKVYCDSCEIGEKLRNNKKQK